MAGSKQAGPVTPPLGVCKVPARTPGTLGINDQADPSIFALLGDTPGPVGRCDAAEPILPYYGSSSYYANQVCRVSDGPPLSAGFTPLPSAAATATAPAKETMTLDDAEEKSLEITTYFEGGKSMNYQALADDFDGQATSFGLIQWNFGQGTLGPLLKKMLDKDATAFANCFGKDADYDTLKKALQDGKTADECKWARDRIKNARAAWKDAFTKIGAVAAFNDIQLTQAKGTYHPLAVAVITDIRSVTSTLFTEIEFRSYAAIFDLCVQQGGIHNSLDAIKKRVKDEKPATQLDLMKIVVTERGKAAREAFRSDCISRRMGILNGASYKSTEADVTAERKNPQLSLIGLHGTKIVQGL